jgi:hypothetical protein
MYEKLGYYGEKLVLEATAMVLAHAGLAERMIRRL